MNGNQTLVENHLIGFWSNREVTKEALDSGPLAEIIPDFRVLRFSPSTEKPYWIYCTSGSFEVDSGHHRFEFFLLSPAEDSNHVLTLSMLANLHADPLYRLQVGSIVEIGDPWIPGSECDHLLISLPYTFGPKLEWIQLPSLCVRVLWALPVTAREAEFARREGVEALEQRFDRIVLPYLNPLRPSVV